MKSDIIEEAKKRWKERAIKEAEWVRKQLEHQKKVEEQPMPKVKDEEE